LNESIIDSPFDKQDTRKGLKRYDNKLNNKTIRKYKNLLIKGHPDKKEFETSSFKTQQWGIFQES